MPVRSSQIRKNTEACGMVKRNTWTTSLKKGMWECLGVQASFFSRSYEFTRSQSRRGSRIGNKLKIIPAWDVKKVRPMSGLIRQAKKDGKTVHFANLMDFCHLKNAELAKHLQGDNVKDEEGHRGSIYTARRFTFSDGSGKVLGHYIKAPW